MRYLPLIFVAIVSTSAYADGASALSDALFKALAGPDFKEAAQLFYYPPSETPAEAADDRSGVAALLETVVSAMGAPRNPRLQGRHTAAWYVRVQGGDLHYWNEYPHFLRYTYAVDYDRYGKGMVYVDVATMGGAKVLRAVSFALPRSRADAKGLMMRLMRAASARMRESATPGAEKPL